MWEGFEADTDLRSFMLKAVADGDVVASQFGVEFRLAASRERRVGVPNEQLRRDRVAQ